LFFSKVLDDGLLPFGNEDMNEALNENKGAHHHPIPSQFFSIHEREKPRACCIMLGENELQCTTIYI
jgi:hypothetical protein